MELTIKVWNDDDSRRRKFWILDPSPLDFKNMFWCVCQDGFQNMFWCFFLIKNVCQDGLKRCSDWWPNERGGSVSLSVRHTYTSTVMSMGGTRWETFIIYVKLQSVNGWNRWRTQTLSYAATATWWSTAPWSARRSTGRGCTTSIPPRQLPLWCQHKVAAQGGGVPPMSWSGCKHFNEKKHQNMFLTQPWNSVSY